MRVGKWICAVMGAVIFTGFFLTPFSSGEDEQTLRAVQRVRVRTMRGISRAMRRVKVYAKKGNYKRVAAAANEVALLTAAIPYLSPKGSNLGKTRIKASVWSQFDDYSAMAMDSARLAGSLAKTAEAEDKDGVLKRLAALGKSCGQCHKPYREKKRRRK